MLRLSLRRGGLGWGWRGANTLQGCHEVTQRSIDTTASREFSEALIGLKGMQVNLHAIVSDVVSSAHAVRDDAESVHKQASALMERSEQQSYGITSVAAALKPLFVSVSEISEQPNAVPTTPVMLSVWLTKALVHWVGRDR